MPARLTDRAAGRCVLCLVLGLCGWLALAGCGNSAVPKPPVLSERQEQGRKAEAFYECLLAEGLPVVIFPFSTGEADVSVDQFRIERYAVWTWAAGGSAFTNPPDGMRSEADHLAVEAFLQKADGTDALEIDGTDHTAVFAACRESSDYETPDYNVDPSEELAYKNAVIEASNAWAQCARENGFPGLADTDPAVADQYMTTPMVLLPAGSSLDQVQVLLRACPLANYTSEYAAPQLGFDTAGLDGRGTVPTVSSEEYDQLMAILSAIYDADPTATAS
jgi:hypothetical protein